MVDSAGEPMPSATLRLEPGGFGATSDDSGRYTLVVPDYIRRAPVIITAREFARGQMSETMLLTGSRFVHDFMLHKPIYGWLAAPLDLGIVRAAGLTDLRAGTHSKGEREIRIRIDGGIALPYQLYRLSNRDGRITGEVIRYVPLEGYGSTPRAARVTSHLPTISVQGHDRRSSTLAALDSRARPTGKSSSPRWTVSTSGTLPMRGLCTNA